MADNRIHEILELVGEGKSIRQIARDLRLSPSTVEAVLRKEATDMQYEANTERLISAEYYHQLLASLTPIISIGNLIKESESLTGAERLAMTMQLADIQIKATRAAAVIRQNQDKLLGLPIDPTLHVKLSGEVSTMIKRDALPKYRNLMKEIPASSADDGEEFNA